MCTLKMQHESQRNLLKLERLILVLMGKAFCLLYYSVQNTQGQQRGHNSSRIIISILNYFCNHGPDLLVIVTNSTFPLKKKMFIFGLYMISCVQAGGYQIFSLF